MKLIKTASDQELDKLISMHENFVHTLRHKMSATEHACVYPQQLDKGHTSEVVSKILSAPHVFALNLQWSSKPNPLKILKMLLSLPNIFELNELY